MLSVTFYQHSKRKNSTKQPTASTPSFSASININDANSSILSPVLTVEIPSNPPSGSVSPLACNYVYIPAFSRYYYILDWSYLANGLWQAACRVDSLASWKSSIINSGGYVARSASYFDAAIVDPIYPAENFPLICRDGNISHFSSYAGTSSIIIVGIIASGSPTVGAVSYWALDATQLRSLCNVLMSTAEDDWSLVGEMSPDVLKSFIDPMQFIVSVKWFPINSNDFFSSGDYTATNIKVWGWDTGVSGWLIGSKTAYDFPKRTAGGDEVYFNIPLWDLQHHFPNGWYNPNTSTYQAIDFDRFPPLAPYANYTMITPFGTYELDSAIISNMFDYYRISGGNDSGSIQILWKLYVDIISGNATFVVKGLNGTSMDDYEFFRKEVQLAVDIPVSQISLNYMNIVNAKTQVGSGAGKAIEGALDGLSNIASGNAPGTSGTSSSVASVASGCYNLLQATFSPAVQSTESRPAAFNKSIEYFYIQQTRYQTISKAPALYGRPLKKQYASLATFSGYVQMDNTSFAAPCMDDEYNEIVGYLTGGMYIE